MNKYFNHTIFGIRNILKLMIIFGVTIFCSLWSHGEELVPADRLKVGVIIPTTGPLAFFGQDFIRTYDLALESYPDLENHIQVIWEDSQYDSKKAVSAFNKLSSIDKVDLIYSFGGPMLNVLAPIAERQKIPFFATESQKSDCEGRVFCSLFRNEEDEWGKATWKYLRERGLKNIGIVKNQNQFMNTFVDALIRTKSENEIVNVLIDVAPNIVELKTEVLGLKSKQMDALGVYLLPDSHRGFLNALSSLNIKLPLFGVEEFLDKPLNSGFDKLIDGTLVIAPGASDDYQKKFEQRYGASAGFFYTPAFYDFLILLRDTPKNLRGMDLVNALHFSGERLGVSGSFSVNKSDRGVYSYSFPIFIYEIQKGSAVVIDKISIRK